MNTKYSWLTASAALLTVLGAREAAAAPPALLSECYVDAGGYNDSDCGTVGDPCKTLKHAVNYRVASGADIYLVGAAPHAVKGLTLTTSLNIHGLGAGNTVVDAGGVDRHIVIDAPGETVRLDGITFTNGSALSTTGGSIEVLDGSLEVGHSEFENNVAEDGGAIACLENCESVKVIETDFTDNSATDYGGAIYSSSSSLTIKRSAFESSAGNWGGAIASQGGDLLVIDTQFSENVASAWGGVIYGAGTDSEVRRSSFYNNEASSGSAIYQFENLLVANTTFAKNSATGNATIVGTGKLWNVTMVDNEAPAGVGIAQDISGTFDIRNSILTHPRRGAGELECTGVMTGARYLTDTTSCGPGRIDSHKNEGLGTLGYHNGPTLVYKLYSTSNAVGVAGSCLLAQDQRDAPRPTANCDLGAYELQ